MDKKQQSQIVEANTAVSSMLKENTNQSTTNEVGDKSNNNKCYHNWYVRISLLWFFYHKILIQMQWVGSMGI